MDRRRKFELPGIQDLTKEQEVARALPKEGQHLIVGGPGTGKSILALLRARRHHRDKDDYLFLVFNHLLDRASGQLFGGGLGSKTWIGWFRRTFREMTGRPVPLLPADPSGYRKEDWDGVERIIETLPPPSVDANRLFLVFDEGQDMPRQFYASLISLGFENFFVVADQNQQITEANSSRQDIEHCLAIETSQVIELRENFRNHYQVARLAREFYTGDPASPPPELPGPTAATTPLLYSYQPDDLKRVAQNILRLADRDPRQLIGVMVPNNQVRERYFDALLSAEAPLDNPRPPIETFHGNHRPDVRFDEGGILVINVQACKGLEFDTAILADIDEHRFRHGDPDVARRLFYVMVARARERVFLFLKRGARGSGIEGILPTDRGILRREDL